MIDLVLEKLYYYCIIN